MRRALLLALPLLLVAAPARAETADQVASALRNAPVYQAGGLDLVDVATLTSELSGTDPQVYVAVLPASAASSAAEADERATEIGRALGEGDAVVLVVTANRHLGAGEGSAAADRGVDADEALREELAQDRGSFSKDNVTAFVLAFAERVQSEAGEAGGAGGGGSGGGFPWGTVLVVGALGAGGGALVVRSRRRRSRLNEGLRAEVEQLYSRLANDVGTLDPGDNARARQALADAAERYNACGAALAAADSPPEFAAARRTAVEGLTAARLARQELGLPLGPDLPAVPGSGAPLGQGERISVGGQVFDGSPDYEPGRPHYYEGGTVGGRQVPGGWYSGRFWEPFVLGSILTGGFGHGSDHDAPEERGGGGDWTGSSGGGDWGGGDSGGGGDW